MLFDDGAAASPDVAVFCAGERLRRGDAHADTHSGVADGLRDDAGGAANNDDLFLTAFGWGKPDGFDLTSFGVDSLDGSPSLPSAAVTLLHGLLLTCNNRAGVLTSDYKSTVISGMHLQLPYFSC